MSTERNPTLVQPEPASWETGTTRAKPDPTLLAAEASAESVRELRRALGEALAAMPNRSGQPSPSGKSTRTETRGGGPR